MIDLTPYIRVSNGIQAFDMAVKLGKLSPDWRRKLNLQKLRIVDKTWNPLAQLFGSISKGLWATRLFEWADRYGFIALKNSIQNDGMALKEEWRRQLRTDPTWIKLNSCNSYRRTIFGIDYMIEGYTDGSDGSYSIHATYSANQSYLFPAFYKNADSAKRAVRRLAGRFIVN